MHAFQYFPLMSEVSFCKRDLCVAREANVPVESTWSSTHTHTHTVCWSETLDQVGHLSDNERERE